MRRPMTGFLSTLNPEQREAALTPFEGDENVGTAVSEQDLIKGMGTLQKRREAAEREARDLCLDRDRWKRRAVEAEAQLRSLGFSAPTQQGDVK